MSKFTMNRSFKDQSMYRGYDRLQYKGRIGVDPKTLIRTAIGPENQIASLTDITG
jgi:hypothetical protein